MIGEDDVDNQARDMTTRWLSASTSDRILRSAVELFSQNGYTATPLRQVAEMAGIQAPSLYNHFESKEHLLGEIMQSVMQDLISETRNAISTHDDVIDQVYAFMEVGIRFHATRASETMIGTVELRSLSPSLRRAVERLHHEYEGLLRELLEQAMAVGAIPPAHPRMLAFAGIAICARVAWWYREGGGLDIEDVVKNLIASYSPTSRVMS